MNGCKKVRCFSWILQFQAFLLAAWTILGACTCMMLEAVKRKLNCATLSDSRRRRRLSRRCFLMLTSLFTAASIAAAIAAAVAYIWPWISVQSNFFHKSRCIFQTSGVYRWIFQDFKDGVWISSWVNSKLIRLFRLRIAPHTHAQRIEIIAIQVAITSNKIRLPPNLTNPTQSHVTMMEIKQRYFEADNSNWCSIYQPPSTRNSLPPASVAADLSQNAFKRALKTNLFSTNRRHWGFLLYRLAAAEEIKGLKQCTSCASDPIIITYILST